MCSHGERVFVLRTCVRVANVRSLSERPFVPVARTVRGFTRGRVRPCAAVSRFPLTTAAGTVPRSCAVVPGPPGGRPRSTGRRSTGRSSRSCIGCIGCIPSRAAVCGRLPRRGCSSLSECRTVATNRLASHWEGFGETVNRAGVTPRESIPEPPGTGRGARGRSPVRGSPSRLPPRRRIGRWTG